MTGAFGLRSFVWSGTVVLQKNLQNAVSVAQKLCRELRFPQRRLSRQRQAKRCRKWPAAAALYYRSATNRSQTQQQGAGVGGQIPA